MKTTWMARAAGLALGSVLIAGPALAQTTQGSGGANASGPAAAKAGTGQGRTDLDQRSANERCNSRKGADKQTCLDEVRAQQKPQGGTNAGATGAGKSAGAKDAVPALQTQSPAVSATGIAPSTSGPSRAPGTPAIPAK